MKSDEDVDVRPTDGLVPIQPRNHHGRLLGTTAAAVATAAVIAGALVLTRHHDTGPRPGPTATSPSTSTVVPVYYLGTTPVGPRLYRELHRVRTDGDVADSALSAAVNEAVAGTPNDPDYRTVFAPGTRATVQERSDTIVVDLEPSHGPLLREGVTAAEARAALQAIVYTATDVTHGNQTVTFDVANGAVTTILGTAEEHGLARNSADSTLSAVSISSPAWGTTVTSPFTVTGSAASFEANVQWELRQGAKVVKRGYTTARQCCTLSPYSFTVDVRPGHYVLVVHDDDESDGEGHGTTEDTKDITVR